MKRILWLTSWYPNKTGPFDGDFVQRMARAASLYNEIFVIAVIATEKSLEDEEYNVSNTLKERIFYYKLVNGIPGKISSPLKYLGTFRKILKGYLKTYGNPDCVHVQIPMKAGMPALWLKSRFRIPYVVTEHYGIYNDVIEDRFSNRSPLFRFFTREIIRRADQFLPVSRMLGNGINELVVKKHFTVIPNTVDTSVFYYKERASTEFQFIHISNMIPLKNAEGIIDACTILFEKGIPFHLRFVGPYPDSIYKKVVDRGLLKTCITFTGEVPYETVALYMQQADCLVMFSNIDNLPCVILEALCCGVPVISTNVGGIPEVVTGENGVLIEPRNIDALAVAMNEMVKSNKQYNRMEISQAASKLYSYETIGRKFNEAYEKVIKVSNVE